MAGDGDTVAPWLPEPGVWDRHGFGRCLGAVEAEAGENPPRLAALNIEPRQEAGYTSAVVTINRIQVTCCNRAGSIYVSTYGIGSTAGKSGMAAAAIVASECICFSNSRRPDAETLEHLDRVARMAAGTPATIALACRECNIGRGGIDWLSYATLSAASIIRLDAAKEVAGPDSELLGASDRNTPTDPNNGCWHLFRSPA